MKTEPLWLRGGHRAPSSHQSLGRLLGISRLRVISTIPLNSKL